MSPMKKARLEDLPDKLPFRMVEYYPKHWTHAHQYFDTPDANAEDMATGLAEAIAACSEEKHEGHGRTHSLLDAQTAYFEAIAQMLDDSDQKEYAKLRFNIARYQKWGGPVPEMVLLPSVEHPEKWNAILTDKNGNPFMTEVNTSDFNLPDPREVGAKPNPYGPGWVRKRRVGGDVRLRRMIDREQR